MDYSKDIERRREEIIKAAVHLVGLLDKPKYKGQKREIRMYKHIILFNQKAIENPFWGYIQETIQNRLFWNSSLDVSNQVDELTFSQPIDSIDVTC